MQIEDLFATQNTHTLENYTRETKTNLQYSNWTGNTGILLCL